MPSTWLRGNWNGRDWFKAGQQVLVVSPGIEAFAQVVQDARSPRHRVRVLLEFMGRLVAAEVPYDGVHPVGQAMEGKRRFARRTRGQGRWIRGFGPRAGPEEGPVSPR